MKRENVSVSSNYPTLKQADDKNNAFTNIFRELKRVSRFRNLEEYQKRQGIIRADIRLSKYCMARIVIDLRNRIQDYIMVGYLYNGKFRALNHVFYDVDFKSKEFNPKKEAERLEKILYQLFQQYHHRIEKAFQRLGLKAK